MCPIDVITYLKPPFEIYRQAEIAGVEKDCVLR